MKILLRNVRAGKRRAEITNLNSVTRKAIELTLDQKVKPVVLKSFEKVVQNWEHKPNWGVRKYIKPNSISINIFPTGENAKIWVFVDEGTKPHIIVPKRAKRLRFQTGYISKTLARPARTVSGGGKYTGDVVYAKRVEHPGNEARNFTGEIAEDIKPSFKSAIENTFRQVAKQMEE